jgi:hypothetical protein
VNYVPIGRINEYDAIIPVNVAIPAVLRTPLAGDRNERYISRKWSADAYIALNGDRPRALLNYIFANRRALFRRDFDNGGLRDGLSSSRNRQCGNCREKGAFHKSSVG